MCLAVVLSHPDLELIQGCNACMRIMRRYWPGRAPDWVQERGEEREGGSEGDDASEDEEEVGVTAAIAPPVVIRASDDPRLRRLAEACARMIYFVHLSMHHPQAAPTVEEHALGKFSAVSFPA